MSDKPPMSSERKCTKCGTSKPHDAFHRKGRGIQSWCKSCKSIQKTSEAGRVANRANQRERRYARAYNRETIDSAFRRGQIWTGPEMEIALREDLTAQQAAALLNRTYAAVCRRRQLHNIALRQQAEVPIKPVKP